MKIYAEHLGRYLQINERICPMCGGSGKEHEVTNRGGRILVDNHRPEYPDLDCCRTCKGKGILKIVPTKTGFHYETI